MQVDTENFAVAMAELRSSLPRALFVAIDTELTGLHTSRSARHSILDTLEERYARARESASSFAVVQFGIALYEWEALEDDDSGVAVPAPDAAATATATATAPSGAGGEESSEAREEGEVDQSTLPPRTPQNDSGRSKDTGTPDAPSFRGRFVVKPFNFFVFPRPSALLGRNAPDRVFSSQASSIDFLCKNGFDFGRCFSRGIPYLNETDEAALRRTLNNNNNNGNSSTGTPSRPASASASASAPATPSSSSSPSSGIALGQHEPFVTALFAAVDDWLQSSSDKQFTYKEPCNAFVRKLVFQESAKRYPTGVMVDSEAASDTPNRHQKRMRFTRATLEEMSARDRHRQQEQERNIDDACGFMRVIQLLSQAHCPVIGHNMLLDLAHTHHSFIRPLPDTLEAFTASLHSALPLIFDTKLIATNLVSLAPSLAPPLRDTSLESVFDASKSPLFTPFRPPIVFPQGFDRYASVASAHEAGFDAFATGHAFATFLGLCAAQTGHSITSKQSLDLMNAQFLNRLYLMQSDYPYLHLDAETPIPDRSHWFHVGPFHTQLKTNNLKEMFSEFGDVRVNWVDKENAFIVLAQPENAQLLSEQSSANAFACRVTSYADYASAASATAVEATSAETDLVSSKKRSRTATETETGESSEEVPAKKAKADEL